MNQKRIFLIISFFLVAGFIFGWIIFKKNNLFSSKNNINSSSSFKNEDSLKNSKEAKEEIGKISKDELKINCKENWQKYENDVLGLTFCYPKNWGEVAIEPIENLTLLEGAMDEYSKDENNAYANSLFIKFKSNQNEVALNDDNNIEIRIFNNNYKGEYYPNSFAYEKGPIDNIAELKSNNNICDYRLNFTELWQEQGKMTEFWDECTDGVKTRIINHEEYFNKNLYSYELESLAYLKLQNNFFDNILVKRKYLNIRQTEKKINSFEEIFEAKNYPSNADNSEIISQEKFNEEKEDFFEFVRSIQSYGPIVLEKKDFEQSDGEDSKVTAIRKYYWMLESQNLEEAYKMQNRTNIPLNEFKSDYAKTFKASARDFKKINDNTFKFFVDYQEHNKPKTIHRITARVLNDGKIEIITTEEITFEMVKFGDYTAYAKKQNNKSFIVLEQYGVETIIDEGIATYNQDHLNLMEVKFFGDIKFSNSGKYLIYRMSGWEWSKNYIYDLENTKQIFEFDSGTSGFSKDEQSFFVCNSSGMSTSASGIIFTAPNFKKKFELFNSTNSNIADVECSYDEGKDELTFVYAKGCEQSNEKCKKNEIVYSFNEDKMVKSGTLNN
ncbi:MAG: hypothetical protein ACD_7C00347G0004 [uncultured bacterium]|nr:MAG: hypothetical protein ACD_7C00347G0004 [uncultured bacterium]KKP68672.1 MAG: hypothetical protein UR66_C0004G0072 [Candidatus Moranbacteria bacterium GW2011_GWE1_35_17]KKP84641.1 MAG: hypothetical protein UR82_C0001G0008 [Candidatus Moranbacteria bacterium GW2011_GWF1_35_5]HBR78836.1 hypothetical protein [Candidatus Moranbacteria bacterium]